MGFFIKILFCIIRIFYQFLYYFSIFFKQIPNRYWFILYKCFFWKITRVRKFRFVIWV